MGKAFAWVEGRSPLFRPALYGALFIWLFMAAQSALYVVPIVLVLLLLFAPASFWPWVLTLFFLAPAGGFLGGLLYGLVSPLCKPLGRVGDVIKFTFGAWGYLVVLTFVILPVIDHEKTVSLKDTWDWWGIAVLGVGIGIVLALSTKERSPQ